MKINQNVTFLKNGATTPAVAATKGNATLNATTAELPAATGQARLTSSTALLPSTNGDFDAARVAEIRASISAGRYQVDTAKIADGLLSTVRDLLNKKSS
ncbi:MAG: flagellar biosynthesis anti-sigma factor FlgM [Polaromonas sp.]